MNELSRELVDGGASDEGERTSKPVCEQTKDKVDSRLAGGTQAVQVGATGHACCRSQSHRLGDVAAATDATITQDL